MGGIGGIRSHPEMASHFVSRTGAGRFGPHKNLAFRNHNCGRFVGRTGRFGNERFERGEVRFGRFGGRGWGGPWWWGGWGYAYPYGGNGYGDYGDYPYHGDPPGDASQDNGSRYDAGYWSNLAMSVQTKLADQGYYHGQVDGVIGSGTIEAVRKFQADQSRVYSVS
jgi:hypothetical protein